MRGGINRPASIAAADNNFLPPSDNDNDNDSDHAELMGKYDDGGNKKGKGVHCHRYRENDDIEALHGLYKEPRDDDDGCDGDAADGDWDDMEEKEREEDNDNNDDVVDNTAVKLFGMHDEAFLGKEKDNNKKKEEDKRKVIIAAAAQRGGRI